MQRTRNRRFTQGVLFIIAATSGLSRAIGDENRETADGAAIPTEWTDLSTGYKLIRLTRRPGPNLSFYFHNNPFVPATKDEGDKMLFYGKTDGGMQLFSLTLKTLESKQLTHRRGAEFGVRRMRGVRGEIVLPKLREAVYQWQSDVYAVNVDTGAERHVGTLPADMRGGISTINADGTMLAGTYSEGSRELLVRFPRKSDYFDRIFDAKLPSKLFTIDTRSKKTNVIHEEAAWLNHLQFSPTDPNMLMFCHEGPWHKLQRIWLINIATREIRKIHERTADREIAGHEFWSPNGKTIWFDLQIPRGETFFLAGYNLVADRETRYSLTRNEWSVHYNISPDGKLFCGDGGNHASVAHADDGQWIYLFRPNGNRMAATRLADLRHHDYELEPNAHFSPDGRWIIFRSNMHGEPHIYAAVLK
jgi:oligogalacturonide lyase